LFDAWQTVKHIFPNGGAKKVMVSDGTIRNENTNKNKSKNGKGNALNLELHHLSPITTHLHRTHHRNESPLNFPTPAVSREPRSSSKKTTPVLQTSTCLVARL